MFTFKMFMGQKSKLILSKMKTMDKNKKRNKKKRMNKNKFKLHKQLFLNNQCNWKFRVHKKLSLKTKTD